MAVSVPSAKADGFDEYKNVGYELFIGALSVLSVVNIFLLFFVKNPSLEAVVGVIDALFVPIFLADFTFRFFRSDNRRRYFLHEWGWADLLSSLPLTNAKIFRLFRIWRVIRLVRHFGVGGFAREFSRSRAQNALLTVAFLVILVLEFGSLAVLYYELPAPHANIKNANDAIWWVYVTVTTVGYGDYYPVTNQGRLVAIMVMTAGVGLFGTLSGFLANKLLTPRSVEEEQAPASAPADLSIDSQSAVSVPNQVAVAPPQAAAPVTLALDLPDYVANGTIDDRIAALRALLDANQRFTDRVRNELDAIEGIVQAGASGSD